MSWLFSQALVAASLGGNSLAGEPFAPLNGTPTPQAFLWRDKTTDAWTRFPSGTMFKPLTADHGKAVLMSFLEAFPAKTSPLPEKAQASTGSEAACGPTWPASLAKWDHASSSWKTHQLLLFADSAESLETFPKWGFMRDGELWELSTPEHLTAESEYGLSPDGIHFFHTPNTNGLDGGSNSRKALKKRQEMWRTPSASEPGVRAERLVPIEGGTPGGMNRYFDKNAGRMAQIGLGQQVKLRAMWPTPRASANENRQTKPTPSQLAGTHGKSLAAEVGGSLNADWTEWLMGWPIAWTDLKPLATDKFQQWQHSHGEF